MTQPGTKIIFDEPQFVDAGVDDFRLAEFHMVRGYGDKVDRVDIVLRNWDGGKELRYFVSGDVATTAIEAANVIDYSPPNPTQEAVIINFFRAHGVPEGTIS